MIINFYFHSIGKTSLSYSAEDFESLICTLLRKGFFSVGFSELENLDLEKNYFMISFDDCFEDVFINALPILIKYNIKATFFPVVSYLKNKLYGSSKYQKWNLFEDNEYDIEFNFMNIDQLQKLSKLGMEIGIHTYSHPNLDELSYEEQKKEILLAKLYFEKELNIKNIDIFCYPRGRYNSDTIKILKESGFKYACITKRGYISTLDENLLEINRFPPPLDNYTLQSILNGNSGKLNLKDRVFRRFFLELKNFFR